MRPSPKLLIVALFMVEATAFAQDAPVTLVYDAPPVCPDEQAFVDLVVGRLGTSPFATAASEMETERTVAREEVVVRVEASPMGFAGTLSIREDREFNSNDCADLVSTLAVVTALAFYRAEPVERSDEPRESVGWRDALSPEAQRALEELDSEEPPAPQQDPTPRARRPRWRWSLQPSLSVGLGAFPGAVLGGDISMLFRRKELALRLAVRGESSVRAVGVDGVRGVGLGGVFGPCWVRGLFAGCGALIVGAGWYRAQSVVSPSWTSRIYVGGQLSLGLHIPLGSVHLGIHAAGEVPLIRPDLRSTDRLLWSAPPLHGRLRVGLAWEIR